MSASGVATLLTYVISHLPVPGFTPPYSIAVVRLEEGPQMLTNIVNCPQSPESLELDMRLKVIFKKASDDIWLPLFEPYPVREGVSA
ncbi:OB-fold domain-containing protein [Variovorax sp. dw_954]|uniref:Zn-ribbon domain-containing OB-fold protein n=1 Tax=Variovorax sp. dw_954 TaxID=2720078 RepID=UPI0031F6A8F7